MRLQRLAPPHRPGHLPAASNQSSPEPDSLDRNACCSTPNCPWPVTAVSPEPKWTPRGFEAVRGRKAQVLARPEAVGWVRFVLEGGRTLYEAAAAQPDAFLLQGREPLYVLPTKKGVRWVVRHYARGGPTLPLLGDRHLRFGSFRPFHELLASEEARARGIPTPQVVAAAVYSSGPFYRADLVTVFVPGADNLAEVLFDTTRKGIGGAVERLDAFRAAGELIRQLASRGLRHGDLHAGNILLRWQGAAPTPLPVGLDRCQVMPEGVEASPGPMYRRLRRSLVKWERLTGLRVGDREWDTLERTVTG